MMKQKLYKIGQSEGANPKMTIFTKQKPAVKITKKEVAFLKEYLERKAGTP